MEVLINEKDVDFGCDISVLLNRGDRLRWSGSKTAEKTRPVKADTPLPPADRTRKTAWLFLGNLYRGTFSGTV